MAGCQRIVPTNLARRTRLWKVERMMRRWWSVVGASVLSFACSALHSTKAETADVDLGGSSGELKLAHQKKGHKKAHKKRSALARLAPRQVGDYYVHRFSGSFREGPLTLVERVVAEKDDVVVVDYTLEDGATEKTLRVKLDRETERPLSVSEVGDDGETPVPVAAYEAMLEQTVFAPDVNDALLDEHRQTCLVGPKELDCEVKEYRVFVGDDEAKLTVTASDDLPGRDIAGEITGVDGSVIYRAELVEAGNTPSLDKSVASK